MVPLDRALVSSCRLPVVVWPLFATQVFEGGARSYRYIANRECDCASACDARFSRAA